MTERELRVVKEFFTPQIAPYLKGRGNIGKLWIESKLLEDHPEYAQKWTKAMIRRCISLALLENGFVPTSKRYKGFHRV